jgi:hypothetical protein
MRHVIVSSIILSVLTLIAYGFAEGGGQHISGTDTKVSGVVSKMQSGVVFIKTPRGQKTTSTSGIEDLKLGEEVDVWVNASNTVIEVRRAGVKMNVGERPRTKSNRRSGADTAATRIEPGLIF